MTHPSDPEPRIFARSAFDPIAALVQVKKIAPGGRGART
jgi:hypothetical protein